MTIPGVHLAGEAVVAFVDGELGSVAHARALVHLDTCAECRRAVAVQREASGLLSGAPDPIPPAALIGRLCNIPMTTEIGGPDVVLAVQDGDLVWGTESSLRGRPVPAPPHQRNGGANRGPDPARRDSRPTSYPHVRASGRTGRARSVLIGAMAGLAFGVFVATASPSVYSGTNTPGQNLIRDVNGAVVGPPVTGDLTGVRNLRTHDPERDNPGPDGSGAAGRQVRFHTDTDTGTDPGTVTGTDQASRLVGPSSDDTGTLATPFFGGASEQGRSAR